MSLRNWRAMEKQSKLRDVQYQRQSTLQQRQILQLRHIAAVNQRSALQLTTQLQEIRSHCTCWNAPSGSLPKAPSATQDQEMRDEVTDTVFPTLGNESNQIRHELQRMNSKVANLEKEVADLRSHVSGTAAASSSASKGDTMCERG